MLEWGAGAGVCSSPSLNGANPSEKTVLLDANCTYSKTHLKWPSLKTFYKKNLAIKAKSHIF